MLSRLEQETTRLRYNTFTALISVSFLLPGFATSAADKGTVTVLGRTTHVSAIAFLLGFLFYIFTVVHYTWYHRYAHRYRSALKKLEVELDINIYRLRTRPRFKGAKFHFDWFLYILGVFYMYFTGSYAGWMLTLAVLLTGVVLYGVMLLWSVKWQEEPLE
ncbi:MAG: hypothetical protein ABIS86_20845 [Streptosporangiaceae bacterium]